jgi:hypothetical protein
VSHFLLLAGMLCIMGECVTLDHDVDVYVLRDISLYCVEGYGCAYPNAVYVLQAKGFKWELATLYHELLHVETGAAHTREMIARDNKLRDKLGICDRYIFEEDLEAFQNRPYATACTGG